MILDNGKTYQHLGQFYAANRQVDIQTGTIQFRPLFRIPTIFCALVCTRKSAPPPASCITR